MCRKWNLTLYVPQPLVICDLMITVEKRNVFCGDFRSESCLYCLQNWSNSVLLLSVISLSLPSGNHPLMLFFKHMLLRIKQTSEVMARNRLFPSVHFNIEISAKLAVHTHTHWNKPLKSLYPFKCWNFPCHHPETVQSKGCSDNDLLNNHAQVM